MRDERSTKPDRVLVSKWDVEEGQAIIIGASVANHRVLFISRRLTLVVAISRGYPTQSGQKIEMRIVLVSDAIRILVMMVKFSPHKGLNPECIIPCLRSLVQELGSNMSSLSWNTVTLGPKPLLVFDISKWIQ